MPSTQFGQTKPVPHGTIWLDCNAHNLPHRWVKDHMVADLNYLAIYWKCERCPVATRTDGKPKWAPKRFLNAGH